MPLQLFAVFATTAYYALEECVHLFHHFLKKNELDTEDVLEHMETQMAFQNKVDYFWWHYEKNGFG